MILLTKVAFPPALGYIIFSASELFTNGMQAILFAAAVITALGVIWARVVWPGYKLFKRFAEGVDTLHDLSQWKQKVNNRLDELEDINRFEELARAFLEKSRGPNPPRV